MRASNTTHVRMPPTPSGWPRLHLALPPRVRPHQQPHRCRLRRLLLEQCENIALAVAHHHPVAWRQPAQLRALRQPPFTPLTPDDRLWIDSLNNQTLIQMSAASSRAG